MKQVTVTIEKISPKQADVYLLKTNKQRQFQRSHVITLSRQMSQEMWHDHVVFIMFDWNDDLMNGQHTLRAIVHSGTTQVCVVIRGMDPEAFHVLDTGMKRTYKDALHIAGFTQVALYGGLANKVIQWERMIYLGGKKRTALVPTNEEIVRYCQANTKEMAESINYYLQVKTKLKQEQLMSGGLFIFLYHMFKESNKSQAFDFMDRILSGKDVTKVPKYQPVNKLRTRLIQNAKDDAKLAQQIIVLMTVGAWNAYRQNKKLHTLAGLSDIKKQQGKKIKIF